ncbi:hypothetical protein GCM10027169_05910 [Gordonia jinhuaensis]
MPGISETPEPSGAADVVAASGLLMLVLLMLVLLMVGVSPRGRAPTHAVGVIDGDIHPHCHAAVANLGKRCPRGRYADQPLLTW